MNWFIIGCFIWSVIVFMVGYPALKLPSGEIWLLGTLVLIVIAMFPWGLPLYRYFRGSQNE